MTIAMNEEVEVEKNNMELVENQTDSEPVVELVDQDNNDGDTLNELLEAECFDNQNLLGDKDSILDDQADDTHENEQTFHEKVEETVLCDLSSDSKHSFKRCCKVTAVILTFISWICFLIYCYLYLTTTCVPVEVLMNLKMSLFYMMFYCSSGAQALSTLSLLKLAVLHCGST